MNGRKRDYVVRGSQIKSARNFLDWDQDTLAREAGITTPTISKMENEKGIVFGQARTIGGIVSALEKNGISFVGDLENSIGIIHKIKEQQVVRDAS